MSQPFRLSEGGRVDRSRPLRFTFDGRPHEGFAGDTLASALLAGGVHLMGRSFKYHRPRGVLGSGVDEPNALVEVDRGPGRLDPNLQATTVELYDGLAARSQNRWPSLAFDAAAVNNLAAPLIPAGFYYKTFKWPPGAWKALYEPNIRRAAGLGRAPEAADPDRYAARYDHCEVLVVGAGPAGLAAALAASEGGGRVMLCDEQSEPGGQLLSEPGARIDGQGAWDWLAETLAVLDRRGVEVLPRTTAFLYSAQNMVGLLERLSDHLADAPPGVLRHRWRRVRAGRVVLATGAHERPLVFPGNDRPGVMLAGAGRTWANRYGVVPGRRVVALSGHDSVYASAFDLARAGAAVTVADLRPEAPADLATEADALGVEVLAGVRPLRARGDLKVRGIELRTADGRVRPLRCDLLLMGGGWTPAVHLHAQARGKLLWDEAVEAYVPGETPQNNRSAGAARGRLGLSVALSDGFAAGQWGAGTTAARRAPAAPPERPAGAPSAPAAETADHGVMAFVDFQNDVTAKDLRLAVREGFASVEHIKRYTTTGMATDQGRTSNVNAMAVAGEALGVAAREVGVTTYRGPYTPTSFGALAGYARGATFEPVRTTPLHDRAAARGAVFEDLGPWRRARAFPEAGEDLHAAVRRECRAVRSTAGLFDASTLGKIEVVGPDAAEFLSRLYVNDFNKLAPGRCRYGLLLRDDGFVFDDGVVGRLGETRFHVTTSSGGAAAVLHHMEDYLQTEYPELKVWLTSTTEEWAVIAVQGPRARDILAPLVGGADLSREAFPHMALMEAEVCGVPARLFRTSFTGELGFEVDVASAHAPAVWEALRTEGAKAGAVAYGTDAMHVLRAEKGLVIVGQETDGTVTPHDLGLGWTIGRAKRDFVGKRSQARADLRAAGRKQLVGLLPQDRRTVPDEGAQLVAGPRPAPFTSEGHVTSAYWSEALQRPFALALLVDGRARLGSTVHATRLDGDALPCEVVTPVFYDPERRRIDA